MFNALRASMKRLPPHEPPTTQNQVALYLSFDHMEVSKEALKQAVCEQIERLSPIPLCLASGDSILISLRPNRAITLR